jgi:hypothetical protein
MIFSLSHLATDTSAIFERGFHLYFVERGRDHYRVRKHKGKKRTGRGGSKEEGESGGTSSPCRGHSFFKGGRGESNNTFPIGKKKGIGWRPQKNTGALSSQLGSSFSFERRLKNGGESLFSAGGGGVRLHRRVIWFNLSTPPPFCSKKKDRGYKKTSEACGRWDSVCEFCKKDGR